MKLNGYDFSGYATKNGLKCSDGRTILPNAFKDADGKQVPLVWQHLHNDPNNILGHAILENKEDGTYAYAFFNDTPAGKNAKIAVQHNDIKALSIYANDLRQKGQDVVHGTIREVSLVLAGANPGALIDFISFQHGDDYDISDEEAIIYTGLEFELAHSDNNVNSNNDESNNEDNHETVEDIINSMTDKQQNVLYALVAYAQENKQENKEENEQEDNVQHSGKGETFVKKNVFDGKHKVGDKEHPTLTHDQLKTIFADAVKTGSLKESFLAHAVTYGIDNIDYLFPDAKNVSDSPDLVTRRMEWVTSVIDGAKHSPFSRIKSRSADLTLDTARAKGYVKGSLKKEEFFALSRRTTTPTTFYKKQRLDRDDIIDIVDLDVVAWLKAEMRMMLDEELGRAVLIGDGRDVEDEDKINELNIRPIATDDNFYAHQIQVAANTSGAALVEEIIRQRVNYKGSGNPTFFTTDEILIDMLLLKDKMGRRLYPTVTELASELRVSSITPVEVMEGFEIDGVHLLGIMVNMKDYTLGADKGGEVSMFDDFDIDYNQYKYLMEARCSGALTKPKSALIFWRGKGTKAIPDEPTFVADTNTITIPTVTGVVYSINDVVKTDEVIITEDTTVDASPDEGYYFAPNTVTSWDFVYTVAL